MSIGSCRRAVAGAALTQLLLAVLPCFGLLLFAQQKGIPTQEEVLAALAKLEKDSDDPDANTVAGKYKAFVMGEFEAGMSYLRKSKDLTLKALAEHESDVSFTALPDNKMKMGDEWLAAGKKLSGLAGPCTDRATYWYIDGWKGLEGKAKEKARLQGRKMAVARPPGPPRKGVPADWKQDVGVAGRPPVLDGTVARTGSYSIRIPPADEKVANSVSALVSNVLPISGKMFEFAAYIFADGTESATDRIALRFIDAMGQVMGQPQSAFYPADIPFWHRTVIKGTVPENAVRAQVVIALASKQGAMWVDDVSLRIDGKDIVRNGSYEEK